jgi:hypothetical protein
MHLTLLSTVPLKRIDFAYWYLVANFLDNLYDDDGSESGSGWISWFCDLEGHDFFVEVSHCNSKVCSGR